MTFHESTQEIEHTGNVEARIGIAAGVHRDSSRRHLATPAPAWTLHWSAARPRQTQWTDPGFPRWPRAIRRWWGSRTARRRPTICFADNDKKSLAAGTILPGSRWP